MHKKARVWCDGCYDMLHYGHINGFRQSRQFGGYLIVGIHTNEEILRHKGLPVMDDHERYEVLKGVKYVDEVVWDVPYVADMEICRQYNVDFIAHAEDPAISLDGRDAYEEPKRLGIYKEFERTHGISTTGLIEKILRRRDDLEYTVEGEQNAYLDNLIKKFKEEPENREVSKKCDVGDDVDKEINSIQQDSLNIKASNQERGAIYIDGVFDLYHAGHYNLIKEASSMGPLVVGLFNDTDAMKMCGFYPIMNYKERLLNLLANKHITNIIEARPNPSINELNDLGIVKIIKGVKNMPYGYENVKSEIDVEEIDHGFSYLTEELIIQRLLNNFKKYESRNRKRL